MPAEQADQRNPNAEVEQVVGRRYAPLDEQGKDDKLARPR